MDERTPKLTVIRGRKRIAFDREAFLSDEIGPQGSLFAEPKRGVVVFVCFPEVEEREFVELLEGARPRFVIDLRVVPRFDVGRLNRARAFDIFEATGSRYIDLTGMLMDGAHRDDVMRRFRELLTSSNFDLFRPVVFLISHPDTSVATDAEVLSVLAESGKEAKEIMLVPAFC